MTGGNAGEPASPAVGIFWILSGPEHPHQIVADATPLHRARPYADFLTHGGHSEFWDQLAALGAPKLRRRSLPIAPIWSEYEGWPRGRVVFHVATKKFIVYADRKLWQRSMLNLILVRFGVPDDEFSLRGDPHYVSVR